MHSRRSPEEVVTFELFSRDEAAQMKQVRCRLVLFMAWAAPMRQQMSETFARKSSVCLIRRPGHGDCMDHEQTRKETVSSCSDWALPFQAKNIQPGNWCATPRPRRKPDSTSP